MRDGLYAAGYRHAAKPAQRHVADSQTVPAGDLANPDTDEEPAHVLAAAR